MINNVIFSFLEACTLIYHGLHNLHDCDPPYKENNNQI